jgi:hypothetical protein
MPDNIPGFDALIESEENQLWASGPDNQHKRFHIKAHIKSTVVDSGNSPTTTIRGGRAIARKDSDGFDYLYSPDATDGTQSVIGLLEKHLNMLGRGAGAVADRFTKVLTAGIIRNIDELISVDKAAVAVLLRTGFTLAQAVPHGSAFLMHPRTRYFDAANYTILDADHGSMRIATAAVNYTLPDLATVGKGFEILLFNGSAGTMVVTGAADTINTGDAAGGLSTTITFSTANRQRGASVLMYADYVANAGALAWYPLFVSGTPVYA